MKRFLSLSIYFLVIVACSKKESPVQDPFDPAISKVLKNEAYGTDALQMADIYLPANRGASTKTLVLIHGGFWVGGDKTDMDTLLAPITTADPTLAIVNLNYRLADGAISNQHPAQMNDIKLMLDYLDDHAATWHIGKQYALTGVSSGGHLAMLFAYAYDAGKRVKVVASVLGPTNFADTLYINSPLFQQLASSLLGKTWLQDSALHKSVSPVRVVKADAPPTFMAYGDADPIVPVSNPDSLDARLTALGIIHQYTLYTGESHDISTVAILDIITKMAAFFKAHF
jgi:acetyl esterase/lipase